ncbi:InlB B-repeat-containing protein [Agathobacter sp.]
MHTKLRHFIKKAAVTLALGVAVLTGISAAKPQTVQAADHIYKNKTFYVYAEHAVIIRSYFSDDKVSQSKLPNWNNRGYGTINIYSEGSGFKYNNKNCYRYKVEMKDVDVKNKTPYIYIYAPESEKDGYYPVSARITNYNNDNGCNVKANEYKQLPETLDASNMLFAYIGYSFTGTEMEIDFDHYQFDVSYDLNGGKGDSSSQSGYFSSKQEGVKLHSAPSKTGYTFNNWICNRDGKPHNAGSNYYPNDWSTGHLRNQITMTADYTAKPYYVSYNPNKPGNASSNVQGSMPSKVEFRYDKPQNLSNNSYTLTGWTFTGWNTKPDGTGKTEENQMGKQEVDRLFEGGNLNGKAELYNLLKRPYEKRRAVNTH